MPRALTPEEKRDRNIAAKNEEVSGVAASTKKYQIRSPIDRGQRVSRGIFNGTKGKLNIDISLAKAFEDAGWHLHIFNDEGARIQEALEGGYEFVTRDEVDNSLADKVVPMNTDLGEKVRFRVGNKEDGDGMFGYLMKTPMEWHLEDQKMLQEKNNRIDEAIRSGKNLKPGTSAEGFYNAGISIK